MIKQHTTPRKRKRKLVDPGDITSRFINHTLRGPSETISNVDAHFIFRYIRQQSDNMVRDCVSYPWLLDLVTSDTFVTFYLQYIRSLCDISSTDNVTESRNRGVRNFLNLQLTVWNVTDKSSELCWKLNLKEACYYLFRLLQLPQLHPSVCLLEDDARLLAHSSIGVLHNLLNHIPNIRSSYRRANGVRILMSYVSDTWLGAEADANSQASAEYLSLRTAALLVLSVIVDETENESLHADDSHIVYLLNALDNSLKCDDRLYSFTYGYQAQELLAGLTNLAGPDRNKVALVKNDAMNYVERALEIVRELKFPYIPEGTAPIHLPNLVDVDVLAEKALEFLCSLSFVRESHPYLTPGSNFRRLFEHFATDPVWSPGCKRLAEGILWNLSPGPQHHLLGDHEAIYSMMGSERRERRRDGHLMISYQHSTKDIMIKVRDQLIALGYSVWMDVDYTSGSFVDSMALGIEEASGVILGLSQAFKNSQHCRQEVKYAYHLGIPLFPLQLEANFNPDGWLGLILATILYIPLTDESMLTDAISELQKQLGDRGHSSRAASSEAKESKRLLSRAILNRSFSGPAIPSSLLPIQIERFHSCHSLPDSNASFYGETCPQDGCTESDASKYPRPSKRVKYEDGPIEIDLSESRLNALSNLSNWKTHDVSSWLQRIGLGHFTQKFSNIDGSMLIELARLRSVAPESLCTSLHRDFDMNLIDQLRLLSALSELTPRATTLLTAPI